MRHSFWLFIASGFLLTLSNCSNSNTSPKHISGHEEVMLKIAHANEAGGNIAGAETLYLQAVASSPGSIPANLELAEFFIRQHEDKKAITVLNGTLKLSPNNNNIARMLANSYINAGEPDKAIKVINKAIEKNDSDALLYNSQGVALDLLGRYTEAQAAYRKALSLDPADEMTFKTNLSMSYIASHNYNDAVSTLLPLMSRPNVTPTIRQDLALAYGMKGESDKALALGLKDLPPEQAKENVQFYHMAAKKPAENKTTETADHLALEDEDDQVDADNYSPPTAVKPLKSIKITEENYILSPPVMKPSPPPANILPQDSKQAATLVNSPTSLLLPAPVLKPNRLQ